MDKIRRLIVVKNKTIARKLKRIINKLVNSIDDWRVTYTNGYIFRVYIRDLNSKKIIWTPRKRKHLGILKSALSWADYVYIALDSNNLGEHLALQVQNLVLTCNNANIYRIHLKEITEAGVKKALNDLHKVDEELAISEKLRVEINKVLEHTLSLAALRVFGKYVAVDHIYPYILNKIIKRERQRRAYKYNPSFYVKAHTSSGIDICSHKVINYEKAEWLLSNITSKKLASDYAGLGTYKLSPPGPFTFLSLTKFACAKYKIKTYDVRKALQSLYQKGYISYYDTDENYLSKQTAITAWKYIKKFHNRNSIYSPNYFEKNVDKAIRPLNINIAPKISNLKNIELSLYTDIWCSVVSSQCADAVIMKQSIDYYIDDQDVLLSIMGEKIVLGGWTNIAKNLLPENKQALNAKRCKIEQAMILSSTPNPPRHYTVTSLLQILEEEDFSDSYIYIEALEKLELHKFITITNDNDIIPRARGEAIINWLTAKIPYILSYDFISKIESELYLVQRNGDYIGALTEANPIYTKLVHQLEDTDILWSTILCQQCHNKTQVVMDEAEKDPYIWCEHCDWWTYITFDGKGDEILSPIFQQEAT